ncbi:unnamed protein product [Schistosoma rodhaini]|uniref:Reverse transcriptase domain-containing protein n=1 Tax=Schistosoma rodhaini TaxID=6188 RepID=A0AA85G9A8_9TREM|nr:unnamed protein product [Schistosoma rodhaini]
MRAFREGEVTLPTLGRTRAFGGLFGLSHKDNERSDKKHIQLLKSLENQPVENKFLTEPKRYVHNFFSKELNKEKLEVLALGLKFCDTRNRVNHMDKDIQFENLHRQTSDLVPTSNLELERFKASIIEYCYQFKHSRYNYRSILTKKHKEAISELINDENLIITKPDKGTGTVLLNRNDYIDKMNNILNDHRKFQKLNNQKDVDNKIENELTRSLKKLRDQQIIPPDIYESIKPIGTHLPRLYGLPKVHKRDIPLKPILDMYDSPYHTVAKWLVTVLKPLHKQLVKHCIKDVFQFVEKIKNINIKGLKMMSFDVTSFFTNVPFRETVEYICEQLREQEVVTTIPVETIKELLLKCTMNAHFKFNGEIYRQIDGVAMGSPLGPILADIFLAKLENGPLTTD